MSGNDLLEKQKKINKKQEKLNKKIKEFVTNIEIPLADRWDLFKNSNYGEIQSWNAYLSSLDPDICIYDGLYHVDKYQTVCVFDIVDKHFSDYNGQSEIDYKNQREWEKYSFDRSQFMEECLEKGLRGWVHDW